MLSRRALYASCGAVLAGLCLLLGHLLRHQSVNPVVWGRYSLRFFGVLCILATVLFVAVVGVMVWRRRVPAVCTSVVHRLERRPGVLTTLIVGGGSVVGSVFVFRRIIALFFPASLVVAGVAVLYLGLVGIVLSVLTRTQAVRIAQQAALMGFGLAIGLGLGEVGLRVVMPSAPYLILPQHVRWAFDPVPGVMPGISGVSVYTTHAIGVRGDPYTSEGRYAILAVGGSTTECVYLDDAEAWPHLLQQQLNAPGSEPRVWVGNVGRSGHGVVEHLYALRHFVPQFRFDAVVVVVGINDLAPALRDPAHYDAWTFDPDNDLRFLHRSFVQRPLVDAAVRRSFPENLASWNLIEKGFWRVFHPTVRLYTEDEAGLHYIERRRLRQEAPRLIDTVPDLSAALDRYERNLKALIDAARMQQVRLILATQPAIWHESLSNEAERLLWLGYFGEVQLPSGRYTMPVLTQGLALFNQKLLEVCRATGTECLDLAAALNGDEGAFYDDVHFNEQGAQKVADVLADYLKTSPAAP